MPELPKADLTGVRGFMAEGDLLCLRNWANKLPPELGDLLEVGSYKGLSSAYLASVGPHLTCVDWWFGDAFLPPHDYFPEWERTVAPWRDRITAVRSMSQDYLPTVPNQSCRLVFIDGDHDQTDVVKSDLTNGKRILSSRGILLVDDWMAGFPTVENVAKKLGIPFHREGAKLGGWVKP